MTMQDALKQRISLRAYDERPIEPDKLRQLEEAISRCNTEMKKNADHPAYLQLTGPHLEDGTAVQDLSTTTSQVLPPMIPLLAR